MNCEQYQHELLAAAEPAAPPPEVATHLASCPACLELQRRLVSIERQVRLLPVPASDARQQFLQRILTEPLPGRDTLPLRRPVWRRLALGTAAAAAVAAIIVGGVMVGGWLAPSPDGTQQPMVHGADKTSSAQMAHAISTDPKVTPSRRKMMDQKGKLKGPRAAPPTGTLANRLIEYDLRLASADTREERRELLADLGGTLQKESKMPGIAAAPDVLDALSQMYTKVVGAGVMARAAEDLPGNPTPDDAVHQFQSDQRLIRALVDAGLRLAEEEDTLKRAAICNGVAAHVAQEIRQAAANKDGERVTLLGRYLQTMLDRGVARIVRQARSKLPAGSPREEDMKQIVQETARFLQPVPDALTAGLGRQAEPVLMQIAMGKAVVDNAIQDMNAAPPPPRKKLPGKKRPGEPRP